MDKVSFVRTNFNQNEDDLEKFFRQKYFLDDLAKKYFGYLDYEYIISFTQKEYNNLFSIIGQVNKIFLKTYSFYFENLDKNLTDFYPFLGYFRKKFPLKDQLIWRYDILIDKTWEYKFIETNANTPWLITDLYHVSNLLKPDWYINQSTERFSAYVKQFFGKYKDKNIWILLPHSFEDEDFLVCKDYKDILKDIIPEENLIIWDIFESNIVQDEYFYLKGQKIDVILSFFPLEFFLSDMDFATSFFSVIYSGWCILHNPIESIALQDKLIFAVLYENFNKFDKIEQEIIKRHIPFTTRVFQEDTNSFLAKARFWRIAREVFDSNFYTNIYDKEEYVFQEKVISKTFNEDWNFIVLGAYTNYKKPICLIGRRGFDLITKDDKTKITTVYIKK